MLTGLKVSQDQIAVVLERKEQGRGARGLGGSKDPRLKLISSHSILSTRARYPLCQCEEKGLVPDMPLFALIHLQGCRDDRICQRLDSVRRMNGH